MRPWPAVLTASVVALASVWGTAAAAPASVAATTSATVATTTTTTTTTSTGVADPASWWGTNGRVSDTLVSGDRVYLAGGFDYVGPTTGYGVPVDSGTGVRAAWPSIDGPVDAAIPDGAGGWYVAGRFKRVGTAYRPGAARVTAEGLVSAWNPRPGSPIRAMARTSAGVVLGGDFLSLAGVPATHLAAVDPDLGSIVTSWTAAPTNATVRALAAAGGAIYAGGDFTTVGDQPHSGLVRLDASTGATDPVFAGAASGAVQTVDVSPDGSVVYVGGTFTAVSGPSGQVPRSRLAAFTADGVPTSWAPAADGTVRALRVDPATGTVFVGGLFGTVSSVGRARLAAVTAAGAVTSFNALLAGCNTRHTTGYAHSNPPCSVEVAALQVRDGVLYVGGRFGRSGTTTRHDAAAFLTGTGALTAWNPTPGDRVNTLAVADDAARVYVGGEFTSVNGQVRQGVAALDMRTGQLDPTFSANTDNEVLDLALSTDGTRLFLAGSFLAVRGVSRPRLASVVASTGSVDGVFKPAVNNSVLSIGTARGWLFAGGQFTTVNGVTRRHVARLWGASGALSTTFVADTVGPTGVLRSGGMVQSLAVSSDAGRVYLGGPFTTVNGRTMPAGIAVVYGTNGALHPRQLGGVGRCSGAGPWITRLYLSPDDRRLYGGDVCPDNIYQWDAYNLSTTTRPTGLLWRTWCNGGMQGAFEVAGRFYYGTHGSSCAVAPGSSTRADRARFAAFSSSTGALVTGTAAFDSAMGVWSVSGVPGALVVGGDFTTVNGVLHQGVAVVPQ
ncbi:hypothetical protein [Phycicoccus sp. Soil748]|uniref:hypothetical protein n=1 Tax=Phycicoccus sp. Soil748 TaxID=1736397 RepID=UPI0007028C95|nr:hypothetical protein [Phycicoccus sp. Soil748]KRE52802.1 hypothetical protein ASG70_15790 [Phycicoccus sp. Soil748]